MVKLEEKIIPIFRIILIFIIYFVNIIIITG